MLRLYGDEHVYALCRKIVCFVHVSCVDTLGLNDFQNFTEDLVLVRWLGPYYPSNLRDNAMKVVCPYMSRPTSRQ